MSWRDLAAWVAREAGFDEALVGEALEGPSLNTALTSERGILLPPLDGAVRRFFRDSEVDWSADTVRVVAAE